MQNSYLLWDCSDRIVLHAELALETIESGWTQTLRVTHLTIDTTSHTQLFQCIRHRLNWVQITLVSICTLWRGGLNRILDMIRKFLIGSHICRTCTNVPIHIQYSSGTIAIFECFCAWIGFVLSCDSSSWCSSYNWNQCHQDNSFEDHNYLIFEVDLNM